MEKIKTWPAQPPAYLKKVVYYDETDSTNSQAFRLEREGAPDKTLVVAATQSAGRGRQKRPWESPAGGLYFSLLLRPLIGAAVAPLLTLAVGLETLRGLRLLGIPDIWMKWPNDLWIGKKKVAGILTEMVPKEEKVDFVVIGMGINVNAAVKSFSTGLQENITSLQQATGKSWELHSVLEKLLFAILDAVDQFVEQGPRPTLEGFMEQSGMIGRAVLLPERRPEVLGTAIGLNLRGELQVRQANGELIECIAEDIICL